ncbi:MAG: ATP-binding protein, partial [Chloroflexia bacterium]|nr:ATP-binding protein [Chloroflexia bacterium]
GALEEFVLIERQVALAEWRRLRNAPPEERVLAGVSLIARYRPEDQPEEGRERNRAWREHRQRRAEAMAALRVENPEAAWGDLPQGEEPAPPDMRGQTVRLRVETAGVGAALPEILGLSGFRPGDWVRTLPRWTVDSRLPVGQQVKRPQTPRQLLYGVPGKLAEIEIERDDAGRAAAAWVHFTFDTIPANDKMKPFAYPETPNSFFLDDESYTIEETPNDLSGYSAWKVVEAVRDGQPNALFARLADPDGATVVWSAAAELGQRRFLDGLDALAQGNHWHAFPAEVREYIGRHGGEPLLLVQGPPGTGKSYTTAFALFARMQGAMEAGIPFRVGVCANTHAATDVLLEKLGEVRSALRGWRAAAVDLFSEFFDARLLDVALFRFGPKGHLPEGVEALLPEAPKGQKPLDRVNAGEWGVVAATPSGLKNLCKGRKAAPGGTLDALVLDEASRMKVPEALLAGIPLKPGGPVVVVGDHRQMQPIRRHDWDEEPRKTFQEYKVYRSVFDTVRAMGTATIRLSESHRLHEEMAEFLRREIYHKDAIDFRSGKRWEMERGSHPDPYVDAVLRPEIPIVVVVHDEAASQLRNETERDLIAPVAAEVLKRGYGLREGFGIVVPHRAQRALLQEALRGMAGGAGGVTAAEEAVDTVERFQGGEREVIVVSATESDPAYLLAAGEFLYDPTRLTVALSRAKRKLVLVAARSVFGLFSPDDEVWENTLLWKNLLRRTCTEPLWEGEMAGHGVQVWGRRARGGGGLGDETALPADVVGSEPMAFDL